MMLWLLGTSLALAQVPPTTDDSAPLDPDAAVFQDAAVLVGLTGTGWVQVADQEPIPLDRCIVVPLGATVCTGSNSFATIRLAPDPATPGAEDVVLLPQTCLDIEEATAERTSLAMSKGGISVAADRDGQGELSVRTRDGTAAGRSGGFRITLEDSATRAEAVTGPILLRTPVGELDLAAGMGSRLREGQAPDAAQQLTEAQGLIAPEPGAHLRRPDFQWEPVPYSTGYRVELAANPTFTDIVEAIDLADPRWQPELLFVPTAIPGLWWRVAAYDRFGFLGVPSPGRLLELPGGVAR